MISVAIGTYIGDGVYRRQDAIVLPVAGSIKSLMIHEQPTPSNPGTSWIMSTNNMGVGIVPVQGGYMFQTVNHFQYSLDRAIINVGNNSGLGANNPGSVYHWYCVYEH